jgi:autotransporter-associated beta strand protein
MRLPARIFLPLTSWLALVATLLCLAASMVQAADRTWDADSATAGSQDGDGAWNTANTNWWTGSTNVNWTNSSSDTASFGVSSSGSYTVTLDEPITIGGMRFNTGTSYTLAGNALTLAGIGTNTSTTFRIDGNTTIRAPITGVSALYKDGTAALVLDAENTYGSGAFATDVRAGVMVLKHGKALGKSGYAHVYGSAALQVEGGITVSNGIYIKGMGADSAGSLRSTSGSNAWAGFVRLHQDNPDAAIGVDTDSILTISGAIEPHNAAKPGSLTKVGAGTLVLSGNSSNFKSPVYVNAGVLTVQHANALGTNDAGTTVADGARLEVQNGVTLADSLTLAGTGADLGALRNTSGSNTWSGPVTLAADTTIGVEGTSSLTLAQGIGQSGDTPAGWTKIGTGTLVVQGDSSYRGEVNINAGRVNIRHANALGATTAGTSVTTGAALQLQGGITVGNEALALNGDGISASGAWSGALQSVSGNNIWQGSVSLNKGSIGVDTGSTLTIDGQLSITDTWRKQGGGKLILTAANNFSSITDVVAGALNLRDSNAAGTTSYVHVYSSATLELENNITISRGMYLGNETTSNKTVGLRSAAGTNTWAGVVYIHGTHPHARIGVETDSVLTISGAIQPHNNSIGSLTKVGSGTLILTNATNTYAGPTYVEEGLMQVDGSIAASPSITVAAGATLGGKGRVPAIGGAGLVSPGASPGILTVTSVDPQAGLDFAFEFTSPGSPAYGNAGASVNDLLRLTDPAAPVAAALDADNEINIYLNVADLTDGMVFRGGFFTDLSSDFASLISGASYNYYLRGDGNGSQSFNDVNYYRLTEWTSELGLIVDAVPETASFSTGTVNGYVMQLTAVPVPEPSTWVLLLAGVGIVPLWLARRR